MGTNSSKNEDEKEEKAVKEDEEMIESTKRQRSFGTLNSSILNVDNLSAYSGLKSETESVGENIDKAITASTLKKEQMNQQLLLKDGKIPTLFEWNEEGKMVYITGTFCAWTQFFIMSRRPNGTFQLVLDLPKGVYQYKFKVDNQWRYSTTAPTIVDNDQNLNNIIDNSYYVIPSPVKNDNNASPEVNDANVNKSKIKTKGVYETYYPGKLELNTDAPRVPMKFYSNLFNIDLNTKQWIIGNKEYLHKVENNLLSENNSCKSLARCPHISVCHLVYQYNSPKFTTFEIVCQVNRLRNKMLSIVYYKPRKKIRNASDNLT